MLETIGYEGAGPNGLFVFILLTLILGTSAAFRTGQAVATAWSPAWPLVVYSALLAAAVRFLSFALFSGPLLSLSSFLIDWAILTGAAFLGYRMRRTRQMTELYSWIFKRMSPISWTARATA